MKTDTTAAIAKVDEQLTTAKSKLELARTEHVAAKKRVNELEELREQLNSPEKLLAYAVDRLLNGDKKPDAKKPAAKSKPAEPRVDFSESEHKAAKSQIFQLYKQKKDFTGKKDIKAAFNDGRDKKIDKLTLDEIVADLVATGRLEHNGLEKGLSKHKAK